MDEDGSLTTLRTRYEEFGTNFRTAWDLYLKFYTVFLTFNIAAMAWLFGDPAKAPSGKARMLVVMAFILQDILTAATSITMCVYSRRTGRLQHETEAAILSLTLSQQGAGSGPIAMSSLPVSLASWAGVANFIAMLCLAAGWFCLAKYA